MRPAEVDERQPEPVTPEVIRKLRRALARQERMDAAIHAQMGLGPSGTVYVPVRCATLRALLDAWEGGAR